MRDPAHAKNRQPIIRELITMACLSLAAWLCSDLFAPWRHPLTEFDPQQMARLEIKMWRAYYDQRPLALWAFLSQTLHQQAGLPWLRARVAAFHAARAAFLFKKGRQRADYLHALPSLERYFAIVARSATSPLPAVRAAMAELQWWILHRERRGELEDPLPRAIAEAAAALYGVPAQAALPYAALRARAMRSRDDQAYSGGMTEDHWRALEATLAEAYEALWEALHPAHFVSLKIAPQPHGLLSVAQL